MTDYDDVLIGKISERIKLILKVDLGSNDRCFLKEERANEFVSRWEDSYLAKISEGKKILKTPKYVSNDAKNKRLYFIRDYVLKEGGIRFAGIVLSYEKQLQLIDIKTFEGKNLNEIKWLRA